jgi:hypothetical protein
MSETPEGAAEVLRPNRREQADPEQCPLRVDRRRVRALGITPAGTTFRQRTIQ